jgi:hypothetical protein
MDGIHLLNKSRVMTTCRADGTVLKPDRPLTIADECFTRAGGAVAIDDCFVYHTYSDLKGLDGARIHYHFNNKPGEPITLPMLNINPSSRIASSGNGTPASIVYNWYTGEVSTLDSVHGTAVAAGYEGHVYAVVAPATGGWAFIGEVDKYTTASSLRFQSVSVKAGQLTVAVVGTSLEEVRVCAVRLADETLVCQKAVFPAEGGTQSLGWPNE